MYDDLLEAFPTIGQSKFFDSELPKDHNEFDWSDFHYTDGMQYKAPPVLQHSNAVSLSGPAKKHEADLQAIRD
ncbi:hypothetical protein CPC16_005834, partial [Podila verticillata]